MLRIARPLLAMTALCSTLVALPTLAQDGRAFTPQDLVSMERVSDPRVSPDGRTVVYGLRQTDLENNRGVTSLWSVPVAGGEPTRLPISDDGASTGRWGPDGKLYFMRGGQVWVSSDGGQTAVQATSLPLASSTWAV